MTQEEDHISHWLKEREGRSLNITGDRYGQRIRVEIYSEPGEYSLAYGHTLESALIQVWKVIQE